MSQKQHQQQCDEAEQQRLYHDSIRSYWTPERIRNAKPKDDHDEPIPGMKQQQYGVGDPPTKVSDLKRRTELPYKNVGRITFKSSNIDYIATAYVAITGKGNNIVFTAAHNLYDEGVKSEKIMFTPALQSDGSAVPAFGQFPQLKLLNSWVVSPDFDSALPRVRQYDIGAILLGPNADQEQVGEVLPGLVIETKIDAEHSGYVKDVTTWKIIGYPDKDMYESDGVFVDLVEKTTHEKTGYVLKRTNSVLGGMSGGPWVIKDADGNFIKSNGDQSGHSIPNNYTLSPFYKKKTIDDLLALL